MIQHEKPSAWWDRVRFDLFATWPPYPNGLLSLIVTHEDHKSPLIRFVNSMFICQRIPRTVMTDNGSYSSKTDSSWALLKLRNFIMRNLVIDTHKYTAQQNVEFCGEEFAQKSKWWWEKNLHLTILHYRATLLQCEKSPLQLQCDRHIYAWYEGKTEEKKCDLGTVIWQIRQAQNYNTG